MRLQGTVDGAVYASVGRTVYKEVDGRFERLGDLPAPAAGLGGLRSRLTTTRPWKSLVELFVGAYTTVNVWPLGDGRLIATTSGRVFVSDDDGASWRPTWRLPPSSGPMGVLPTAFCRHGDRLLLGEYPLAAEDPCRILESEDGGETWRPLVELDDVRHVHAIAADPYADDVWVTTGDTDAESRICRLDGATLEVVGRGSQRWRAVDLAFTPTAVLWGVDSVYERNRVFRLDRSMLEEGPIEPEPVYTAAGSVYYWASVDVDGTPWVAFTTAAESGPDSTAPSEYATVDGPRVATVVAASAASDYTDWTELARFEKRRVPLERLNPFALPLASAYVFLAADPDRGLVLNPYNTAAEHGTIIEVPPDRLRELAAPVVERGA